MSRYEINEAGDEVTDTVTGLTWARCSVGQTWDAEKQNCVGEVQKMNWDDAMKYADSQEGWRLPTIDELATLVDKNYQPTIDNVTFPNTGKWFYWSSSPHVSHSNAAWFLYFLNGVIYLNLRSGNGAVRLVKTGG